jgi:hypothetical protein
MKRFNYASIALAGLILLTAALRIGKIFPPNFSPVTALCLMGGAYFSRKWMAFIIPTFILAISDMILGMGSALEMGGVYVSYFLIILTGFSLKNNVKPIRVILATLSSSVAFFIITNFTCWYGSAYYTQDWNGFITNYIGAIPYFRNTLVSDLLFSGVFFAAFEWIRVKYPRFALSR